MKSLIHILDKILAFALIMAMSCILLAVSWQVISRYLLQDPSSVTEELSRFLLIWIGMLGAVYAYRQNAHLGLDLLVDKMTPAKQRITRIGIQLVVIIFSALVLLYGGAELVDLTIELKQISASLGINMGVVYAVLPVTGGMLILYALFNLSELISGKIDVNVQEQH
ncbi:TRAP transporter small permease [Neptunicella sp.]|uniref:TRAP transporter small permease n=1 Tax=Neptunicella sp. TaxID=2125986 RepID=UPI003F68DDDC